MWSHTGRQTVRCTVVNIRSDSPDLDNSATLRAGQHRYSILVGCSVVAEFPLWLMYIINLMFNSFLPYERKIKCIFLTTYLICHLKKNFRKNPTKK